MDGKRDARHHALAVFLGDWKAEGTSYGGTDQTSADPKANGVPWVSTHREYWHTGKFFLVQDEKARPGGEVFDTLSVMGIDPKTGRYFSTGCFPNSICWPKNTGWRKLAMPTWWQAVCRTRATATLQWWRTWRYNRSDQKARGPVRRRTDGAHRHPYWTGGGGRHWDPQAFLRRVGRHR